MSMSFSSTYPGIRPVMNLFLIAVAFALPATARAPERDVEGPQIVGHVPFEGKALVDMVLTTGGAGRRYLYVQHSDKEVSILDVTEPSQSVVFKNTFWLEGMKVGEITFFGDYTIGQALPSVCNRAVHQGLPSPDGWRPEDELSLCGFNHVKRAISDQRLLYVLSDTGLWIVKTSPTTAILAAEAAGRFHR